MEGFEIFLKQDYIMGNLGLYFVERRNGKTFVGKPVDIIMEEIDESTYSKPTITFLRGTEDLFIEAIKKYLDTKGIKLNEELKLEGKIIAQEKHLEDMRKIVFRGFK